ncbi:multidrug effflux MFS transporter [Notoacmeibacter sp. MSK16QG-6]|uniref:multidrug effflux MFS transporter n=1 Tax=Notoacmeibacter sp. MSK16QG-6 TaxID=2957982 RepID=UPI00209F5AF0|nr:multidrug effflux MFS transporter [Notoacmeibacter sp. MSK16QG-6]MCP1199149.1 multidrug effflux MFS transporter [Notoacmeibacter sp. MSK16QG-6]
MLERTDPSFSATSTQAPDTAAPIMSERRVSLLGALFVAIGPISMALYTPAMTQIVDAFGTTEAMVKLTLTLYFAGFAVSQLIAGPLSDALGRRPVTIIFMAIYFLASVAALFAPSVGFLIAARFVQGVGASAGQAIARAVVRDLFTSDQSSRIMNLIGIILAVGPALAPTIGGLMLEVTTWQAIFVLMAVLGLTVMAGAIFGLRETVAPDRSRLNLRALGGSYLQLLGNRHFLTTSGVIGGAVGAMYTQATFLPFILMNDVGLSASQFGLSMLMQTGSFFVGSLTARALMRFVSAYRLVPFGLLSIAIGSLGVSLLLFETPSFLKVMIPVAFYAFGIALVMPAMLTASLAPFPHIAGAASSLTGFIQMGSGLLMGTIGAMMGDPQFAMGLLIPIMGVAAIVSYVIYRFNPHIAEPEPTRNVTIGPQSTGRALRGETNRNDR